MLPVLSFTVQANRTEGTSNKWAFLLKVIRLIGLGDKTGINQLLHSRLVYYIRGDKEFQGEPERVYGANWAKTGSKWAYNPHIREGRGQIDQKSANAVGYDPEDGVQRAPNLRILLLLPRIDFPVCLYFFCNMPSDCAL